MKKFAFISLLPAIFATHAMANTPPVPSVDDVLTGDSRTACEVILCLSSAQGKGIAECQAPLRKYFSIRARKWHKTLAKRRAFLDLCPAANENAKMSALTTAIQNQEYACDAATLNSRTERQRKGGFGSKRTYYRTQTYLPQFCKDLYNHEFTEYKGVTIPKYTCDANKWYRASDWNRGFEQIEVSRKWNSRKDSYDVQYKDVPIKKDCWQ